MKWQINNIKYPVYNLGTGKRIGLWVQGCTLACKGCINKTLWSSSGGKALNVLDTYNLIIDLSDGYDGITISGGEPFEQYDQMITFLHMIKTNTALDIFCFTGYDLSELDTLYPDKLFYKYIDTLMTGRYEVDNHSDDNKRGSSNQKLFRFTDGNPEEISVENDIKTWGLHVGLDGQIQMTGIPKKGEIKRIENDLKKVNIIKKFI
jgi:anaerobic ribonucleoside-triphosphate reductase activating protein